MGGTVGGGFGGKVDTVTEPLAVLAAQMTGKPVRFVFNREEEMQAGSPRGAERIFIKDGVMNDGRLVARQIRCYFDAGAYTRLSSYAIIKCTGHLPGPYTIPNVKSDVFCVYTNRTPATAMRGFGVTGVDYALECHADKMARLINMNPIEFRILNAYRDGDIKAHRREAKNCALIECCQVAAEKAGWSLSEEARNVSSLHGGGGERAKIPETPVDQEGLVNGQGGSSAGIAPKPVSALPPQFNQAQQSAAGASQSHAAASATQSSSTPEQTAQNQTAADDRMTDEQTAQSQAAADHGKPGEERGPRKFGGLRFSSISGTRRR